ncbi:OmpW/AlkL family protein [Alkalilimnicola ehrlichii MLHE-1]|uniref:OmpW family protein n=1 Tax=Alkalilimnicola ehrlichii (strain ATCC BAA-1101 / DSM 17681 / MLHE-1) TaxID=187272 RepID=Q0AA68_ALKEH|nr:OmpW family outer membrane protein [Alkalilimnicola ehrlichii]ABI56269.1 OmpW family protein [Alkalilimnicola ehrlichii MLHE-1]
MSMRKQTLTAALIAVATAGATLTTPVLAAGTSLEAGNILVRGGFHQVSPKSDNGSLTANDIDVDVGDSTRLSGTLTYMVTPNIGVELLAALPFEHNIRLDGLGKVGSTKQLPPTLSVQYHFSDLGLPFRPYAGVGLNYTNFFDTKTSGPLDGNRLSLDDSWGLGVQIGVDVPVAEDWFVNAEVRYIEIETDAKLNGDDIGTVEVDPTAIGISLGRRF